MGRAPCCDKANVKRGPWSPEEDTALRSYLEAHGTAGNWIALPKKAGLRRCGKSCRLRWLNYLRPNIKHGGFTEEEDNVIISLYSEIGSRWSVIASQLPRRTDNDVKNYWNTKLKKKLLSGQINIPTSNNATGMSSFSTCSNSSVGTNNEFVPAPQHSYTFQGFPDTAEQAIVGPGTYSTSIPNYRYGPFINSHSPSPDIGSFMDFKGNMNSSLSCSGTFDSSGNSPSFKGNMNSSLSCSGVFDSSGNSPSLIEKNSRIMSYTADGRVICEDGGPSYGFGFSWDLLINEVLFDEKSTGEISLGGVKPQLPNQSPINFQY